MFPPPHVLVRRRSSLQSTSNCPVIGALYEPYSTTCITSLKQSTGALWEKTRFYTAFTLLVSGPKLAAKVSCEACGTIPSTWPANIASDKLYVVSHRAPRALVPPRRTVEIELPLIADIYDVCVLAAAALLLRHLPAFSHILRGVHRTIRSRCSPRGLCQTVVDVSFRTQAAESARSSVRSVLNDHLGFREVRSPCGGVQCMICRIDLCCLQ